MSDETKAYEHSCISLGETTSGDVSIAMHFEDSIQHMVVRPSYARKIALQILMIVKDIEMAEGSDNA